MGKKRLKATSTVRLKVLASDSKCQLQPQDGDRQSTPQPLKRGPQAKQALVAKKRSRAPAAVSASNQQDAELTNQLNSAAAPTALERRYAARHHV